MSIRIDNAANLASDLVEFLLYPEENAEAVATFDGATQALSEFGERHGPVTAERRAEAVEFVERFLASHE